MKIALLCLASVFTIISCSKDDKKLATGLYNITENAPQISSWQSVNEIEATSSIQVLNQFNQPVVGAQVLIGSDTDAPFKNNLFTTDKNGIDNVKIIFLNGFTGIDWWIICRVLNGDTKQLMYLTLKNKKS